MLKLFGRLFTNLCIGLIYLVFFGIFVGGVLGGIDLVTIGAATVSDYQTEKREDFLEYSGFQEELRINAKIVSWFEDSAWHQEVHFEFFADGENSFRIEAWASAYRSTDERKDSWIIGPEKRTHSLKNPGAYRLEITRLGDGVHKSLEVPGVRFQKYWASRKFDTIVVPKEFTKVQQ